MGRYWNDYISHSQMTNSSGARSDHKYVYREWGNGRWIYYYPEDLATMRNTGTAGVKVHNDAMASIKTNAYAADKRSKEAAVKKQLQEYKKKLRAKGVSSDAIQSSVDDIYRINKGNFIDTKDNVKIYKGSTQKTAQLIDNGAKSIVRQGTNYYKSSQRNTKNALKSKKKKAKDRSRNVKNLLYSAANKKVG